MDSLDRESKHRWRCTLLIYSTAIALCLLYANLKVSRATYADDFKLASIESLNPVIRHVVGWSTFGVCLFVLVISAVSFSTNWLRWPALGLLIGFVLYPYCVLRYAVMNLAPWTMHGEVTTDDGKTFVFCDSSFLQGQVMVIAQTMSKDILRTRYRVLVENNGDSPRSWASVIRPNAASDEYGQLYLKDGLLIGIRYENKCYLAYDLGNERAYGHGDVELLSPFVCLSTGDIPNEIDIRRTFDRITEYSRFCETSDDIRPAQSFLDGNPVAGCPPTEELRTAVATKPAPVVAVATLLLDCYDDAYARLRSRIALKAEISAVIERSHESEATVNPALP
jgi:hypothetical protein